MPADPDEVAAWGFPDEDSIDRVWEAVRHTERLMRTPAERPFGPRPETSNTVVVKILGFSAKKDYWLGRLAIRNCDHGTSTTIDPFTTTTTSTSTTTTSTTTTCRPVSTTTLDPSTSTTTEAPATTVDPDPEYRFGTQTIAVLELNRGVLGFGCLYHGLSCCVVDGVPLVLVDSQHSEDCEDEANLGTTPEPLCPGRCKWTRNLANCRWELTSRCCVSEDCECVPPDFCPPSDSDCAETHTYCSKGIPFTPYVQCPQDCNGGTTPAPTTTGPPTTSPPPDDSCTFCRRTYVPGIGWEVGENNCNPQLGCECPPLPLGTDLNPSGCVSYVLPCIQATTTCEPRGWGGYCTFICGPDGQWLILENQSLCWGTNPCGQLSCGQPSIPCTECGGFARTPCMANPAPCSCPCVGNCVCPPGCETTTPDPNTTTTFPPGPGCHGDCLQKWSVALDKWVLVRSTCETGCACESPPYDGANDCEYVKTPCVSRTTTSTTSTTPAPCGTCQWVLSYEVNHCAGWVVESPCTGPGTCICAQPPETVLFGGGTMCAPGHEVHATGLCSYNTTTTTAAPCTGKCQYTLSNAVGTGCCIASLTVESCGGGCHCPSVMYFNFPCPAGGTFQIDDGCALSLGSSTTPFPCTTTTTTTTSTTTPGPATTPGGG